MSRVVRLSVFLSVSFLLVTTVLAPSATAQQATPPVRPESETNTTPPDDQSGAEADRHDPAAEAEPESSGTNEASTQNNARRTESAAALRNENVFAAKLDADTQKADNQRLGGSYVIVSQPLIESNYWAAEYGQRSSEISVLARPKTSGGWHGELFETLHNSAMNARTFFQVGAVQPSRMNNYGGRFTGRLPVWGFLSGGYSQVKNRGMVNGNVLVLLPNERVPLVTDPVARALVQRIINAFPNIAPNRPDFDPRALNTNSPQSTDATNADLRLDGAVGPRGFLSASHSLSRENINAFQLVAGQNPDTSIHNHRSRLTYRFTPSEATEFAFGGAFTRNVSDLHAEPNTAGPRVRFGNVIESLGPRDQYPLNRIENTFRYGMVGTHRNGAHRLTFGGDVIRYRLDGFEQNLIRGKYEFNANFGRSSVENLLLGQPTSYAIRIGDWWRSFRSWRSNIFIADQWNVTQRLQIYAGVRHYVEGRPHEVNNIEQLPYSTDWNNLSPRLSIAYRAPGDWIIRTGYSVSFGEILPVTFSQIRYNVPAVISVSSNNPNMANPLAGVDLTSASARNTATEFSPNMVSPYSHQYNFTIEHAFGPVTLDFGYIGSRSLKLLQFYQMNRADVVPGIALTTATINLRRPDPNHFEIFRIVNGGIAYLDAAQVAARFRPFHGFTGGATYTFGKAIDMATMYNSTAANQDLFNQSQYQYDALRDQKSLSQFDSTHSLALFGAFSTPRFKALPSPLAKFASNWQISTVMMAKTGTPFSLASGSDAPGFGNVDGAGGDRIHILDPSILGSTVGDPETSTQILSRDKFRFIAPSDRAGNLGRNTFRKGPIVNVNASLARDWRMHDRYQLRFQADAFNLTNHPQFDAPQFDLSSPAFGKITNTLNDGRVLQLALRLSF